MKSLTLSLLLAGVLMALPAPAPACPACSEAIAASSDDDGEVSNFPRAMNQSIYLMVSVPYITLAVVGYFVYRGCRKNAQYIAALERASAAVPSSQT
jgi:hypothetical protein